MVRSHTVMVWTLYLPKKSLVVMSGPAGYMHGPAGYMVDQPITDPI